MSSRRSGVLLFGAAILLGIAALFFLRRAPGPAPVAETKLHSAARPPAPVPAAPSASAPESTEPPSPIADDLGASTGTIRRDLEILNEVFEAWRSNFPRDGNPVGENAEITAALAGGNALHFVFIPKNHRAINARGELCDRWGTPFRFHQVSGQHMEIRSAGPDRKFGTVDDAQWPAP